MNRAETSSINIISASGVEKVEGEWPFKDLKLADFAKHWKGTGLDFKTIYERNVRAMQSLEHTRPGICKALSKNFGIHNFYKFPEEILIKQYETMDSKAMPYGILVVAESDSSDTHPDDPDYNDGQNTETWQEFLKSLNKQAGKGFVIRAFECRTFESIKRALKMCQDKYSKSAKADFIVISGHSNSSLIALGKGSEANDAILGKSQSSDLKKYQNIFKKNAQCLIDGCEVMRKHGIGHWIRFFLKLSVIGISGQGSLESATLKSVRGTKQFKDIKYTNGCLAEYV